MSERLTQYIDGLFAPYEDSPAVQDLREELRHNSQEKLADFKTQGYADEVAYSKTIASIGDVAEIMQTISARTKALLEMGQRDFSDGDLRNYDLKRVKLHAGNFNDSTLKGADFTGSDLTGSTFNHSAVNQVRFDEANLTGARFFSADLRGASFKNSVLDNTDFTGADLSGITFDSQKFTGTIFNEAILKGVSFRQATFRNVSFKSVIDVKKASFEGATMDNSTYAELKSHNLNLANVTLI